MIVLTDDQKEKLKRPTRKNMINAMKWLVNVHISIFFFLNNFLKVIYIVLFEIYN